MDGSRRVDRGGFPSLTSLTLIQNDGKVSQVKVKASIPQSQEGRPKVSSSQSKPRLTKLTLKRRSTFYIAEQLRLSRLSTKLKAATLAPKALTDAEEYRRAQEGYETEEEETKEPVAEEAAATKGAFAQWLGL